MGSKKFNNGGSSADGPARRSVIKGFRSVLPARVSFPSPCLLSNPLKASPRWSGLCCGHRQKKSPGLSVNTGGTGLSCASPRGVRSDLTARRLSCEVLLCFNPTSPRGELSPAATLPHLLEITEEVGVCYGWWASEGGTLKNNSCQKLF